MRGTRVAVLALAVVALVVFVFAPQAQAERPDKPKKATAVTNAQVSDGTTPEAIEATAWVIYDDNSQEAWGSGYAFDAVGNKFSSTWGTFYCDMVNMYAQWTASGTALYLSAWNALSGSTLQSNTYSSFASLTPTTGTGWVMVDGSVTSQNWIGNSTYTFSNTAWIGNDISGSNAVGIDTNGPGSHGFGVTAYTGTGYTEQSFNAMIRARFNGDNVPVELMSFSAE